MNSDKAAAVRDSINGCPTVVGDDAIRERDGEPRERYNGDIITGDHCEPNGEFFQPAYVEQSGTFGDGSGRKTPVYVVVLETLWTDNTDVRSLSAEMVYEIAKHDCSVRFYPPDHRLDGDVWIVDHFSQDLTNTDGDRCPECESTYFKIRDGQPECARCGASQASAEQATLTESGRR